MLVENTLFGVVDKVKLAIERLKTFEPSEGYYLAFSGGKDSQCIYHLAQMGGVKFDAHFNFTTVDPPELIQFIKQHYSTVLWNRPKKSLWQLIVEKRMPPTRVVRYCCEALKEGGGAGRKVVTGIRWAESNRRSKRKMVENCFKDKSKVFVNPIIDWEEDDVWEFIRGNKIPYCRLYDEGFTRIGCVACPMQGAHRLNEFRRWPNFERAWRHAMQRCYEARVRDGLVRDGLVRDDWKWTSGKEMFNWWMNEDRSKNDPDQTVMFE